MLMRVDCYLFLGELFLKLIFPPVFRLNLGNILEAQRSFQVALVSSRPSRMTDIVRSVVYGIKLDLAAVRCVEGKLLKTRGSF